MIIIGTLYYGKFKFQNCQTIGLLKLGVNYSWYHMAHAEPDTSSRPCLNHRSRGRLKHTVTTWITRKLCYRKDDSAMRAV